MNMKMITTLLLLFVINAVSYGQSKSENRTVGSFDAISVCCGIDLYITEGNSSDITVETNYPEHISRILTEVKGRELKISFDNKILNKRPNNMRMKVSVSASNLTAIKASSGADVYSTTPLLADDIKISASSGADIKIELNAKNLDCSASSGSDIKLTGTAVSALVKTSSGSDIDMKNMIVKKAEASASSGSDVVLHVTQELKAKASSGGDVKYKGNPGTVDKKKSSGGGIRAI
ncbi:DUF2807 domain-containing protein [Parabacteroides sp. OttesenSCG-928-O15]|nr:DUF2807 domain-containing protein [Parabacteroides sp. OttesenSCG-928-O15]